MLTGDGLDEMLNILFHTYCRSMLQIRICFHIPSMGYAMKSSQLLAMDVSVRATMKGAAKCDKHCELQNSVSRQGLEHILCFWDIPKSMLASVSLCIISAHASSHTMSCCDLLSLKSWQPYVATFLRLVIDKDLYAGQSNKVSVDWSWLCSGILGLAVIILVTKHSRHEVRLANPLNLSI